MRVWKPRPVSLSFVVLYIASITITPLAYAQDPILDPPGRQLPEHRYVVAPDDKVEGSRVPNMGANYLIPPSTPQQQGYYLQEVRGYEEREHPYDRGGVVYENRVFTMESGSNVNRDTMYQCQPVYGPNVLDKNN